MRTPVLLAAVACTLLAPAAVAQQNSFALGTPTLGNGSVIAYEGAQGTSFVVPWTFAYPNAAFAVTSSADQTESIHWQLACHAAGSPANPIPGFLFQGPLVTDIPLDAMTTQYEGEATFTPTAPRTVVPGTIVECAITGTIDEGEDTEISSIALVNAAVGYDGPLRASTATPTKQAGPQKQVTYNIDLSNDGTVPIEVRFEVTDEDGKPHRLRDWYPLVPDAVIVGPKSNETAVFVVATPFENGYNKGSTDLTVRAIPYAVGNDEVPGQPVDVEVTANVKGFYVPGPQLPLLLAALGLAIALRARRI